MSDLASHLPPVSDGNDEDEDDDASVSSDERDSINPHRAAHDSVNNRLKRDRYYPSASSSASSDRQSQSSDEVAAATTAQTTIPSGFGGGRTRVRRSKKRPRRSPSSQSQQKHNAEGDSAAPAAAASWERHTRGIGSKILAKLGFTGRLGKNEDGLSKPLEPRVRPHLAGVGIGPSATKVASVDRRSSKRKGRRTRHGKDKNDDDDDRNEDDGNEEDSEEDGDDSEDDDDDDDDAWLEQQRAVAARNEQKRKAQQSKQNATKESTIDLPSESKVADSMFSGGRICEQVHVLASAASSRAEKHKRDIDAERAILASARNGIERCEYLALQAREKMQSSQQASKLLNEISTGLKLMSMSEEETKSTFSTSNKIDAVIKLASTVGEPMDKEKIESALSTVTCALLAGVVHELATVASDKGDANQSVARRIAGALSAVRSALSKFAVDNGDETYARIISHVIVRPVQGVVGAAGWDCVRGAAVADMLAVMKECVPRAALHIIGTTVSLALTESSDGGTRMAVLPWIHVVGRRALSNALRRKRTDLCTTISTWRLVSTGHDDNTAESTKLLLGDIDAWLPVLPGSGRSRIHAVIAQYPIPQICDAISAWRQSDKDFLSKEAGMWLRAVPTSKSSATRTVVFGKVANAILNGPAIAAKNAPDWRHAVDVYVRVRDWIPEDTRDGLHNALAALLFIVHAKRVCASRSWTDIGVPDTLLRNCYSRRGPAKTERLNDATDKDRGMGVSGNGSDDEGKAKTRLIEVVELIGREKGITVTRLSEQGGVVRVRFGRVEALVDERRNHVSVGDRRVSINRLVDVGRG